jgi:hypothetical protein
LPVIIAIVLSLVCTHHARAQYEETDTVEVIAPPVVTYDSDDDYGTPREELPPELREVPDTTVSKLKKEKDFEYANDDEYLDKPQVMQDDTNTGRNYQQFRFGPAARTILYILLIGFFVFLIYRLIVVNNLYLFRKNKTLAVDDEVVEEEISEDSIDDRIRRAAGEKDYRTAVRYLYLKGLHLLRDKGWIRYHAQATNHDYVYQVNQYPVAEDFRFLTRIYDYVWYGEFAVSEDQFARLQTDFQRFYQALKR